MKMLSTVAILLAICCAGSFASEKKEAVWTLVKNKKGVKVYTRKVDGIDFKEFKGVITLKTSLTSLVALVGDTEGLPDWIENCAKVQLLKRVSEKETYAYTLSKAPWPVMDRDAVVHNVLSQDNDTLVITVKQTGKPDHIKPKKNIIRVKRIEGFWQFTPQEDGTVQVVYQVLSDPSGALPAWLVNSSVVSQPYKTLLKMKKMVMRDKYQTAQLEFIKEAG
jgi:hypothetical protein